MIFARQKISNRFKIFADLPLLPLRSAYTRGHVRIGAATPKIDHFAIVGDEFLRA